MIKIISQFIDQTRAIYVMHKDELSLPENNFNGSLIFKNIQKSQQKEVYPLMDL